MSKHKLWFKARWFGWGWYPATWEGFAVLGAWLTVMLFIFRHIDRESHSASDTLIGFVLPLFLSILVLIAICWKTGERPRWRWAGRNAPAMTVLMKLAVIIGIGFAVSGILVWLLNNR